MTHEARGHAIAGVDRRLHRKQAEYEVGAAPELLCALLAPGPYRRADVVHGTQAGRLELAFEPEVEVGRVAADEDIRLECDQAPAHVGADAQQFRQMGEHFHQAHHAELLGGIPGFQPRFDHARTADAAEAGYREFFAPRGDEPGAEEVAGSFAGDEGEDATHRLSGTLATTPNRSP